jgi:hypothetical protein
MSVEEYPDTSFLCSLYRRQIHSVAAIAYRRTMSGLLSFTSLLEFEFLQSIELQVWLHSRDRSKIVASESHPSNQRMGRGCKLFLSLDFIFGVLSAHELMNE